jgi:hypothetical protein
MFCRHWSSFAGLENFGRSIPAPTTVNCDGSRDVVPASVQESVIGGCRTLKEAEDGAPVPVVTAPQPLEPKKDKHYYAAELLKLLPDSTKQVVSALLKEHTSWKTVDAFYFGVKALAEPKQPTTTKKV